jgi:FtsP/CotA-like multicopper oxidase with cupredoxin domain
MMSIFNPTRRGVVGAALVSLFVLPARAETAANPSAVKSSPPSQPRTLEARKASLRLLPEPAAETEVWGFDGQVPGPLLRSKKGEEINLRLVNSLDQPLTLSFQGLRYENALDGVAGLTQKPVLPGQSFDYRFTPQDSGFYWYRSHVLPMIPEQLTRGLYGPLIIDEAKPPEVDHDMLLVLEDWKLDEKAQISGDFALPAEVLGQGRIGGLVTFGSKPIPLTETFARGSRLRLRILSAVNARVSFVTFLGMRPFVLAVDGQPCEAFQPVRDTLPIGPGARFDVMFDLPATAGAEASLIMRGISEADRPMLIFKTTNETANQRPPIASLEENPRLPQIIRLDKARRVEIVLDGGSRPDGGKAEGKAEAAKGGAIKSDTGKIDAAKADVAKAETSSAESAPQPWTLNGKALKEYGSTPLFSVKRGTPVTLTFINKTAYLQQMHVHGHHMRLLHDLDDGWEPYWRDCVTVPEGRTKHVAFVADNPGKWVIESLIAERQAAGMMCWFEVT